jgi:splicing factor 3A subunit 1
MAAATPNGADSNGPSKPPPDVIIPPALIRDTVEKTADYIHRKGPAKGPAFEDRLIEKAKVDSKFAFLIASDPYNAYYRWFLVECRAGRGPSGAKGVVAPQPEKPKGPAAPPPFHFSAKMPNISAKDLKIIELTARHTAMKGKAWERKLATRESGNFQFDFLRSNHSFNTFFTQLVDQYRVMLEDDAGKQARLAELRHNVEDRFHVLDRAKQRAEWIRYQEQQKQQEEKRVEDERREYASIDWQNFVVVATLTFDENEDTSEMGLPRTLNDLQSASLEQKAMMSLQPTDRRIEEAAPDDETYYVVGQPPQQMQPPVQPVYAPQQQPMYAQQAPPPMANDYRTPAQVAHDEEEDRRIRERQAERDRAQQAMAAAKGPSGPIKIRENYVPRAAAKKSNLGMAICGNCKQQVPYDELEEHMKIELLDPRWKEQRAKAESRYATTNLSTMDVANNLKRLASQRDDVFDGVTGIPISEEEAARRKRAATQYDGQPDPAKDAVRMQQMQSMNVEEQLRQIKQKYNNTG